MLGASLSAQFEAVTYDWLNLGLQHPETTRSAYTFIPSMTALRYLATS